MPAVGGATPPQTPAPEAPVLPQAPLATSDDYPEGLGDAGKRAIDRMKAEREAALDRAKVAERERDELKSATQTETEKAISQAKKDGAAEVTTKWSAQVRRSEVRSALTAAGVNPALVDLALRADVFEALKVSDDGEVIGLGAAVEALKKATPDLFRATPGHTADYGGGPRGAPPSAAGDMNAAIRKAAGH